MMDHRIGHWGFIIGVVIAVLAGVVPEMQTATILWTLVVLGLLVGVLNITARETTEFLVATTTLLLVGSVGALPALGLMVTNILWTMSSLSRGSVALRRTSLTRKTSSRRQRYRSSIVIPRIVLGLRVDFLLSSPRDTINTSQDSSEMNSSNARSRYVMRVVSGSHVLYLHLRRSQT